MKKYLMTGVAALAICAAFTSCSKSEELYDAGQITKNEAAQIQENYNRAFIATFGQPAANQDWGFGKAIAGTRGVFANGNEWAANDRDDCMYRVPPKLNDDQIKIVRIYFQSVTDPDYEDPEWTDYFIQQVYKGGDNPGPNSTEKYKAADGNTDIIGSDHMDHLAAVDGDFVDHNNNFNHGDCGEYGNVLDFEGTLTTVVKTYPVNEATHRHPDKINLMLESTTASFGYYNSNSSLRRTEYTGLVSWQTIKTWADANGHAGEADCLDDGWNRSFMGFDFEMLVDKEVYSTTKYKDGQVVYYGEYDTEVINYFSVDLPNGNEEVWNGTTLVAANTVGEVVTDEWGNKKLYPFIPGTTEKVPLLSSNSNQYAGTRDPDWNGTHWEHYIGSTKHLSIEYMVPALQANKLPLNQYNWVVLGGTADHYYSDWIVTLTEATKYETTTPPSEWDVRIIAEDLNAEAYDSNATDDWTVGSDWDFNDVVFDVKFTSATTANVKIIGAGGVYPLYVAGHEAHRALGQTGTDSDGLYKIQNSGNSTPFEVTGINRDNNGSDIVVTVVRKSSTGEEIISELTAPLGKPAAKIGVNPKFEPCTEREDIRKRYPLFSKWVQEGGSMAWYNVE